MSNTQNVRVTLPEATLYVSGRVNGEAVTWTNTEENTWEAVAQRSADDVYRVELTIVDSYGSTTNSSVILYYGLLSLITDRTAGDVSRWKTLRDKGFAGLTAEEQAEWLAGMKGAYNYTDWNRVEAAVEYVAQHLTEIGYVLRPPVKKDWAISDIPTEADWLRYYTNIRDIRNLITFFRTTPEAPTMAQRLNFERANDIEQILKDADALTSLIEQSWYYSGEVCSGEV